MKKAVLALVLTIISGVIGIYLGAMLNLDGYLGVILAIAVMGFFVIRAIEDKK